VSAPPFMQMYWSDYFGDTRHLSCEQHGAYLQLLGSMWLAGGSLPMDPRKLAKITGCTAARWAKISDDVLAFFDCAEGALSHKRVGFELEKAREKSIKRAEAGSLGGAAKSLKAHAPKVAIATNLPKHLPEPEPEPEEPTIINACDWRRMLAEAKEAAGEVADLTRPAMHHAADLRALIEPRTGEGCTWAEVLDAIAMVAMRQKARGKLIPTWKWVHDDAWALRDKRLNADAPAVSEVVPLRATGPPNSFLAEQAAVNAEARRRVLETD
jgi:uncharacterized protein YdaU (DUF1376 family)